MSSLFKIYLNSITDPHYYKYILELPFKKSLLYFWVFYSVVAVITTVNFWFRTLPEWQQATSTLVDEVVTSYPSDLQIKISYGNLDINGDSQQIEVPFPTTFRSDLTEEYHYLLVASDEAKPVAKALILLGPQAITIQNMEGSERNFSYNEILPSLELTKQVVNDKAPELKSQISSLLQVTPFLALGYGLFFRPVFILAEVLIAAVLVVIGTSFSTLRLQFMQSMQICLHAITFAETVAVIQKLVFGASALPSLFNWAFMGCLMVVIWTISRSNVSQG